MHCCEARESRAVLTSTSSIHTSYTLELYTLHILVPNAPARAPSLRKHRVGQHLPAPQGLITADGCTQRGQPQA
jgi:hypothetical protein